MTTTPLTAIPSMQTNLVNSGMLKDMVHPLMNPDLREWFEKRFWVGGYFCDNSGPRYVIWKANAALLPHDMKAIKDTLESLEFELGLPPEGGQLDPSDAELLDRAHAIKVFVEDGSLTELFSLTLRTMDADGVSSGTIQPLMDARLGKLVATFRFGLSSEKAQSNALGVERQSSLYFKPKE